MTEIKKVLRKMKNNDRPGVEHFSHQIHNHPGMERLCKVGKGHVIIDKVLFDAIKLLLGDKLEF